MFCVCFLILLSIISCFGNRFVEEERELVALL